MNLQEIRQKYPDYNDMSDADFAQGFHKKFYSDMSFEDFSSKVGYSVKQDPKSLVDKIPGIGSIGNQTPAPEPSLMDKAIGAGEAGISTITGLVGGGLSGAVGGLQGVVDSVRKGTFGTQKGVEESGKKFHEQAAMATYEPRTNVGKEYAGKVGQFISEQAPALVGIMPQLEGLNALSKFKKVNENLKPKEPSPAAKAAAEFEAKKAAEQPKPTMVESPLKSRDQLMREDLERNLQEAGYHKGLESVPEEQPLPFVPELYKEQAPRIPKVKDKFQPTVTEAERIATEREQSLSRPLDFERIPVEPSIPEYSAQETGLPFSVENKLATPVEIGTHSKGVQQGIRDIAEIAGDVAKLKEELRSKTEVGPEQQLAIQSLEHDLQNAQGRTAGNTAEAAQIGRDIAQLKIKTAEGTKTPLQTGPNRGKFGQGGAVDPDVFLKDFPEFVSSVIKDTAGKLKVLYHGTSADQIFDNFKANKRGIFLTDDPSIASMYARDNDIKGPKYDSTTGKYVDKNVADRVIPVYVDIKNPYKLSEQEAKDFKYTSNYAKMQRDLTARVKAQGHDGIIYPDGAIVAFDPKQIVSATSPKIGQSKFGKGQRGSIGFFGKDPFEKFAENLRKEVPNVSEEAIKYAWDKQQAQATPAIEAQKQKTAQGQAYSNITGLDPKISGEVWTPEKAVEIFKTTPDIQDRSFLTEQVMSSGRLQRDLLNNPVTTQIYNLTSKAIEQARLRARQVLDDVNTGLIPKIRSRTILGGAKEMRDLMQWRFANEGLGKELPNTFSAKAKVINDSMNKADANLLSAMNEVLAKDGKKPITSIDNHMPHLAIKPPV